MNEEILNLSIPVYLNSLYVSSRHVERIELLLEIFTSVGCFYNLVVSEAVIKLIEDGSIRDYAVKHNEDDDAIVSNKLERAFEEHIDEYKFGSRQLDDLGYSASELKRMLKLIAYYLVEATLATVYDYCCGEASERGKRLSRVLNLVAVRENGDNYGLPTRLVIEAEISLDHFKRIGL